MARLSLVTSVHPVRVSIRANCGVLGTSKREAVLVLASRDFFPDDGERERDIFPEEGVD